MKKLISIFILLLALLTSLSAQNYSDEQIAEINDSIINEAEKLWRYESASWITTDLALNRPNILSQFAGYFVYNSGDTVKAIIYNNDEKCIFEVIFVNNYTDPLRKNKKVRDLTEEEQTLLHIRKKMVKQALKKKYDIKTYNGYDLNVSVFKEENRYKMYIITGTRLQNIIPIGNDYVFLADKEGKVYYSRKFHSKLIPAHTVGENGETVYRCVHSHSNEEPFITATDICTFRLYAYMYNINLLAIYSKALDKTYTYNLTNNSITVNEK